MTRVVVCRWVTVIQQVTFHAARIKKMDVENVHGDALGDRVMIFVFHQVSKTVSWKGHLRVIWLYVFEDLWFVETLFLHSYLPSLWRYFFVVCVFGIMWYFNLTLTNQWNVKIHRSCFYHCIYSYSSNSRLTNI